MPNTLYELIVTTNSGLYRYRTGDLIEFLHYDNHLPVIRYDRKINDFVYIKNKLIKTITLEYELMDICGKSDTFFIDYLFYVKDNGKIILYLEANKLDRSIDMWTRKYSFELNFVYIDTFVKLNEYVIDEVPRVVTNNLLVKKFLDDNIYG